jgi:hypothetical protein
MIAARTSQTYRWHCELFGAPAKNPLLRYAHLTPLPREFRFQACFFFFQGRQDSGRALAVCVAEGNVAMTNPHSHPPDAGEPLHPNLAALRALAAEPGRFAGVSVRALEPGNVLIVQTRRSRYRLVMLDGRHVLVSGGSLFPSPEEAYVVGATAGGSSVKAGWIGIGLRLELRLRHHRLTTSPVERIAIEIIGDLEVSPDEGVIRK